jgi:hypothetical protein
MAQIKKTARKNITGSTNLDNINAKSIVNAQNLPQNGPYQNLMQTVDDGNSITQDYAPVSEGGGGGGGGGGTTPDEKNTTSTIATDPSPTAPVWPATQQDIASWDCATLQQNITMWQNVLISARQTPEGRQGITEAMTYAQGLYGADCNLSPASPDTLPAPTVNKAPVAVAGESQTLKLPTNSTILDGNGSYDPEQGALNFSWKLLTGPNNPVIQNANTARVTIGYMIQGVYTFQLNVSDAQGNSDSSTVNVTVLPGETSSTPAPSDAGPGSSGSTPADTSTAPVLDGQHAPYQMSGGGNATPPPAPVAEKVNWWLVAAATIAVGYIVFAPNE